MLAQDMPLVFVYGAQMIHPESPGAGWAATVDDYAVRFVAPGVPIFEPVFAALVPESGAKAYGVIVEFCDETWRQLLALERGYEVREVIAKPLEPEHASELGGDALPCLAFVLVQGGRREGRPSSRYARKLAAGARAHGLPREIIDRYERAVAEGGRASLALSWLFPIAARIGLVPTAIILALLLVALIALLVARLSP